MSQAFSYQPAEEPEVAHLITEDDEPVDNLFSEKQQRLLTEPLFTSWIGPGEDRRFLACANVAVFNIPRNPPVVPDMLLSLDVEAHPDIWKKEHRSYMVWEFGKPPDLVVEIVSNKVGGEQSDKKIKYALMRVMYYVIFDPERLLSDEVVTIYHLGGLSYRRFDGMQLPDFKLGLTSWEGEFEGFHQTWLRWTDQHGDLILTGKERAERERAEKEAALARAEQLAEQLRALGHEPQGD
jgi:Uma2 family endonuclease